jgi:hypothetical protein
VVRAFTADRQSIAAYAELQRQGAGTCPIEAVWPQSIAPGQPAEPAHPYLLQLQAVIATPYQKLADVPPTGLLPLHWAELQASAIAADVAAANVASWGPGTPRHWEAERAELVAYARLQLQTASTTASGLPQAQPGFLADRLIALDRRYRHLQAGGWRSLSDALPGLEPFDQWKPGQPRPKGRRDAAGRWEPLAGQTIKYEAQPQHPAGGGLLLPRVPLRCWLLIADRQGLPLP